MKLRVSKLDEEKPLRSNDEELYHLFSSCALRKTFCLEARGLLYIARYFCHAKIAFKLPEKERYSRFWNTLYCTMKEGFSVCRSNTWRVLILKKKIAVPASRDFADSGKSGRVSRTPAASHNCALKRRAFAAICKTAADRMPHNYDISWGKLACNAPCCNVATRASRYKAPRAASLQGKIGAM